MSMYRIFCDETWSAHAPKVQYPQFVFYGVMVNDQHENGLIEVIDAFRKRRGLLSEDRSIELKWVKVEEEWKQCRRSGRQSRYIEFTDIFIDAVREKVLSFGYMFLDKSEFERVEREFCTERQTTKHTFLFMLYFQFLYHCFIKNQVKYQPCQILIDERDLGSDATGYDINTLKKTLNNRTYREAFPPDQLQLMFDWLDTIQDSVQLVRLADSSQEPLVQLADLCAGCVRYALESRLPPPSPSGQMSLFERESRQTIRGVTPGRDELVTYFYESLRSIKGYHDLDLLKPSFHHRFSIFPFRFRARS